MPERGHPEDEHGLRARVAEAPGASEELRIEGLDCRVDAPDPRVDIELAAFPVDTVGSLEVREGAIGVTAIVLHAPEREVQVAAVLVGEAASLRYRFHPGDGLLPRVAETAQVGQDEPRERKVGRELEGAPAVRFRLLPVAGNRTRLGQQGQGARAVRIERQGAARGFRPRFDLGPGDQGRAETEPGRDEPGSQREAAAVALDRQRGLAAGDGDFGEREVIGCALGAQRQRPVCRVLRLRQRPALAVDQDQVRVRLREPRMLASERAQDLLRFVQPARAMQRDPQVETRRHVAGCKKQGGAGGQPSASSLSPRSRSTLPRLFQAAT